jgi:hypothetical protein
MTILTTKDLERFKQLLSEALVAKNCTILSEEPKGSMFVSCANVGSTIEDLVSKIAKEIPDGAIVITNRLFFDESEFYSWYRLKVVPVRENHDAVA